MNSVTMSRDERVRLAAVLATLLRWDSGARVRLLTGSRAVAVYADAPMGVLVFLALPLSEPPETAIDQAVSAHRLRDILGDVAGGAAVSGDLEVTIPDPMDMPPALAVVPPSDGWIAAERSTAADVAAAVELGLAELKRQELALAGADDATRRSLAEQWWEQISWGGLPLKALHAGRSMGMLSHPGARIESSTCAGWKRMATPAGQVFVAPPQSYSGIALSVVR